MDLTTMIAGAPPLQEGIARAIFEERYGRKWDQAKHVDQWLAVAAWEEAAAVMRVLPLVAK